MPEVTGSSPVGSSTVLFCPGLTLSATLWASLGWQGGTVGEAATLSPGQTSYVGRLKDGKTRGFQLLIFCFPGKGRFPFWLPIGRTRIRRLSLAPRKKRGLSGGAPLQGGSECGRGLGAGTSRIPLDHPRSFSSGSSLPKDFRSPLLEWERPRRGDDRHWEASSREWRALVPEANLCTPCLWKGNKDREAHVLPLFG